MSAQGANPASAPAATPTAAERLKPESAPSAKEEAKNEKQVKAPEKVLPHIALILPLASKSFGRVADAVKHGFLAGAVADGKNAAPFRIYASDDDTASLAAHYRKALADGALAIVGGVTRDGANIMVRESGPAPSLALNAPTGIAESDLPAQFFYVSLNLDWEARLAARSASNEGLRRAALIVAASPLSKRLQDGFEKEWLRLGGEVALRLAVTGDLAEGARVSAAMEKANADVAFLATDTKIARVVRPFLPSGLPVFSTSMTIDPRAEAVENLDLESVRFMEMPWFVQPDHPAVMAYSRPAEPMPIDHERLYALGIDAWRLSQLVIRNDKSKGAPALDGVTGRITLEGHQFVRMLAAGEMRDGRPALYKPTE